MRNLMDAQILFLDPANVGPVTAALTALGFRIKIRKDMVDPWGPTAFAPDCRLEPIGRLKFFPLAASSHRALRRQCLGSRLRRCSGRQQVEDLHARRQQQPKAPGDMITDALAVRLAEDRYRQTRARHGKRTDVAGEIGMVDGARFVVLYDDGARLVGVYRIDGQDVVGLEGPALTQVRVRLVHRKVR